jgi:hypothetical protein
MKRPLIERMTRQEIYQVTFDPNTSMSATDRFVQPSQLTRLQRLVDDGAVYVPQTLNLPQFATLQALLTRILPHRSIHFAADLDANFANSPNENSPLDCQLALDELDSIARTRTGFAFADLTSEIQDAILSLIASRDLTTRKLDLSLWLDDLNLNAAAEVLQPE